MEDKPLLKPKMDLIFKAIFGREVSKEILESFLKSVLNIPVETEMDIVIIDPSTRSEKEDDKNSIIDVRVETSSEIINVEIQLSKDPSMNDRVIYGISKTVANQKFSGDDYKLKKVVAIVIAGYDLIKTHKHYHDTFRYHSKKTGHTFSESTEIHTLELKKLPDIDDGSMLWNWLKFIKSEERGEFEMLAQKDVTIGKAVSILKDISMDEALRMQAHNREMGELREKAIRLENKRKIKEAEIRGTERGIEQGNLSKAKETAITMLEKGFDKPTIAEIIKMPIEWVEEIAASNKS